MAPLALDGCVSIGLSRSPRDAGEGSTGELAVAVYRKSADRDAGVPVAHPVLAELQRVDGGARTTVARSMAASWQVDLPPGRYALLVTRKIDEKGDVVPLKKPSTREFEVRPGERVGASVVLEQVPVGLIVLAAVTVVLLVVLAITLADEVDLPPPPPLPDPALFMGVALEIPFRAATGPRAAEPGVADVFPAPGSVVAARRVTVSFFMTEPLEEESVEEGAVLAVGSLSGEIPGNVSWLDEERLLRFSPSVDFRPGEDVTVTLDLDKVETRDGKSGSGRVTTTFRVP
jgi:hypothetical protein